MVLWFFGCLRGQLVIFTAQATKVTVILNILFVHFKYFVFLWLDPVYSGTLILDFAPDLHKEEVKSILLNQKKSFAVINFPV